MFDFDNNKALSTQELISMFIHTCKSICIITGQKPPPSKLLYLAAVKEFERADEDYNETLDVDEILHWIEKSDELEDFLSLFEPKVKVFSEPWVFRDFPDVDFGTSN